MRQEPFGTILLLAVSAVLLATATAGAQSVPAAGSPGGPLSTRIVAYTIDAKLDPAK
jgi:hypothetical protein